MNFEEGVEAFRDFYLREGYSPRTVVHMTYTVRRFGRFLKAQGLSSWAELRPEHARAYQIELLSSAVSGWTTKLTAVRRMGDLLLQEGLIFTHPAEGLKKMPKEVLTPIEPLEPSEVKAILEACDLSTRIGIRDHALFILLWEGCLTFREAGRLTLDDLTDDRSSLLFRTTRFIRGIPFSQETRESLLRYLETSRAYYLRFHPDQNVLFVSAAGKPYAENWSVRGWDYLVGPYVKKTEILKKVSGRAFKWARLKQLLEEGVPEEEVRAMAGYGKTGFDTFVARIRP